MAGHGLAPWEVPIIGAFRHPIDATRSSALNVYIAAFRKSQGHRKFGLKTSTHCMLTYLTS